MMNLGALMHNMGDELMRVKNEQGLQSLKAMMKEEDFSAKCGIQLINWADLAVKDVFANDPSYYNLNTETYNNMLMAFKCTLLKEHHKYFFSTVEPGLSHPGFQRPKLDEDFMDMFLNKYDSEAKIKFLQTINPLNNYMENIQHLILKATIPLFLACNNYELNPPTSASSSTKLLLDLGRTILLCRRSLVLFGQTFAFISSMRQERILDALDLQGKPPPPPSHYPNFEDEFLFGKDYLQELRINELRHWKKKDKFPTLKKPDPPAAHEEMKKLAEVSLNDVPANVDAKTKATIEKLAQFVHEMGPEIEAFNMQRLASNPEFWFLNAKDTEAHKLYQMKIDELRQTYGISSDASKLKAPMAPVSQTLQAKVPMTPNPPQKNANPVVVPQSYCFTPPLPPGPWSKSNILKATTTLLKKSPQHEHSTIPSQTLHQQKHPTIPAKQPQKPCTISNEMLQTECSPVTVDANTKETAEKLAQFVFQIGPNLESVNKAKLASYQEFWFLNHTESPAYQFYEMKLAEFRRSKQLQPAPANYFPLLLFKLLHNIRSTTNPVKSPLPLHSDPHGSTDHGAEPPDAPHLNVDLSEPYESDKENSRSLDHAPHDTMSQVSHMNKTPPQNLKGSKAASMKDDSDYQNTEAEDQPLVSESCDSDSEQSDTEHSEDFLSNDGDNFPSQSTDSDCNAPGPGLSSTGLKHPDLEEHKPEITKCSLTKTHCVEQNCDSVDGCAKPDSHRPPDHLLLNDVHKVTEIYSTEHGRSNYQNPLPPNYNPPTLGGPELVGRKCQVSGIPASLSPNCGLLDPVLEAPKPTSTPSTNIRQDCKQQVSDPQEIELLRFYEVIQETEREAEEQKRLHAATTAGSSGPALSPGPPKRGRPETEVHESFVSGNEKSCGQPVLKKKLKKEIIAAFHGRPGLGYTEAQIKKPVKTVPRSVEQSIGVSGQQSQEDTFRAFRQRMIMMCRGGLPK